MALCLATSLVEMQGFDAGDQMERYNNWFRHGYLSSNGRCFDIGNTVREALTQYKQTGNPYSGPINTMSAGNGSIMRLAPIPMFYFPDRERTLHFAAESSRTTHGTQECLDACHLLADILYRALAGRGKEEILLGTDPDAVNSPRIQSLARGAYRDKTVHEIEGTGYVVKSLEAALWCFWVSDSFEQAILKAANLGDDADTTAAVCGQVAGAFYGTDGIPSKWLKRLAKKKDIQQLADRLYGDKTGV